MKAKLYRRRCEKCGHVSKQSRGQRVCYRQNFGPQSYRCNGRLVPAPRQQSNKEATVKRPQDIAQKKLEHARAKVTELTRKLARLSGSLRAWEGKATRYAKRASLTDAEVAQERVNREARSQRKAASRVRRPLRVGGPS